MTSPHYDLVLLHFNYRRHSRNLMITKHLSKKLKIGIIDMQLDQKKMERTHSQFLRDCLANGAEIVKPGSTCRYLMITRMGAPGLQHVYDWAQANCPYEKVLTLVPGPFLGVQDFSDQFRIFGKSTLLILDHKRFGQHEPETLSFLSQHPHDVIEIGSPSNRYPTFPEFRCDYMIAYPSAICLPNKDFRLLYRLLRGFVTSFDSLPRGSRVYTKVHNVKDVGNYMSDRGDFGGIRLPRPVFRLLLNGIDNVLHWRIGKKTVYEYLPNFIVHRINWLQNAYLFQFSKNLQDEFPNYGFEHFISGVEKGLITGLSTVIWEALVNNVPVMNVDDQPLTGRQSQFQLIYDSYRMKEWGTTFSSVGFQTIDQSTRAADMMTTLEQLCKTPVTAS